MHVSSVRKLWYKYTSACGTITYSAAAVILVCTTRMYEIGYSCTCRCKLKCDGIAIKVDMSYKSANCVHVGHVSVRIFYKLRNTVTLMTSFALLFSFH